MANKDTNRPKFSMWRLIYPLLIFIGASIIASIVFGFIFAAMSAGDASIAEMDTDALTELINEYVSKYSNYIGMLESALVILLSFIFMKKDKKRLFNEGYYTQYECVKPYYFLAPLALGVVAAATGNNLISVSGLAEMYSDTLETINDSIYSGGLIVEIISVGILAPIAEELVFRGLLYRRSREQIKPLPALILTSLLFAVFHGNLVQGIYAFLVGMLCAFALERFKNIWAPILLHVGANMFSIAMTETSLSEIVTQNNTTAIIYIIITAVLVALFAWILHDKVEPKVLVPAPNSED